MNSRFIELLDKLEDEMNGVKNDDHWLGSLIVLNFLLDEEFISEEVYTDIVGHINRCFSNQVSDWVSIIN